MSGTGSAVVVITMRWHYNFSAREFPKLFFDYLLWGGESLSFEALLTPCQMISGGKVQDNARMFLQRGFPEDNDVSPDVEKTQISKGLPQANQWLITTRRMPRVSG